MKGLDSMIDSIQEIEVETNNQIKRVEEAYDNDGANELNEDELKTAVLNGTVPTAIADAGASAS